MTSPPAPSLPPGEQNEYLKLALRAAHMGMWVYDFETDRIEWSPEVREIVGVSGFDGRLASWIALVHPDDRAAASADFDRAVVERGEFAFEFRIVRDDGRQRWLANLGQVRLAADGRPAAMVGTVRDITAARDAEARRAASEQALRESEARFRNVLDSTPAIVFLQDLEGRYLFVNRRVAELSGVPQESWIGRTIEDVAPRYAPALRADFLRARAAMRLVQEERAGVLPDGRPLAVLASRFPLFRADGAPYAICGIGTDITELKRLEADMRQAQKMEAIGRLAGGVAHDFNNLLTVINGHCELMAGEADRDGLREHLAVIRDTGQRAALLTGQLLAFSRKAVADPRVLDLNQAVESAARMLRRVIGENVEFVTQLEAAAAVRIDPGHLEQILVNLVVNARDAMPGGGRLTITTRDVTWPDATAPTGYDLPAGAYVELVVADTGVGMTADVRAQIFEPFFTSKPPGTGTGLGLATVYGTVQQAGGAIVVDTAPGQGTIFRIAFPAAVPAAAGAGGVAAPANVRGGETILVAEDEDAVRRLVGLGLKANGYQVILAGSGAEALRLAERHQGTLHLLLTDVVMPDMGGRALAEAMRLRYPDVPVLFMSGYLDDAVVREGIEAATDAFIAKPFTPSALARKVRERLDAVPR